MSSRKFVSYGCAAAMLMASAGASLAQDGNVLIVEQDGAGNELRVDQSAATNSLVAGVPDSGDFGLSLDPASDTGSFVVTGAASQSATANGSNTITILEQDRGTAATQAGLDNTADITLTGNSSFAGLEQLGVGNDATIRADGYFSGGIIVQQGNENIGSVTVDSDGAFGELIQLGNGNEQGFTVSGSPNASVSFTVQGNNTSTTIPANVVTNAGGQVTIVQRQLGGFN